VSERLLTARELAELLGLSPGTVLDRFEAGDLPGFRLYGRKGAPVRFRWSEILAALEEWRPTFEQAGAPGRGVSPARTGSARRGRAYSSPLSSVVSPARPPDAADEKEE
jgi:excisionase family DNA binding protein